MTIINPQVLTCLDRLFLPYRYSYIHTNQNKETYLLTPSPQGDLCVAKMVPPPGTRGPGGPGDIRSDPGHSTGGDSQDRSVRCEASRNLRWSITNTGINAPVYKLTLPNPDAPGHEQPLFQISKPNPMAPYWTMFYFTYAGHLIPPKRIEFGKIQKNAAQGSGGGGGTRVTISGKSPEEKAVWQTLGEGNEDMVEWIVLCAALNVLDEEIIKAAAEQMPPASVAKRAVAAPQSGPNGATASRTAVPSSRPSVSPRIGGNAAAAPRQQFPVPMPAPGRGPPPPQQQPQRQQQQQAFPRPNPYGQAAQPMPQQQYAPQPSQSRQPPQQMPSRGPPQGQYQEGYRQAPSPQMQGRAPPPQNGPAPGGARPMGAPNGRAPGGGIVLNSPQSGYGGDGFGGGGSGYGSASGPRSPQQAAAGGRRF